MQSPSSPSQLSSKTHTFHAITNLIYTWTHFPDYIPNDCCSLLLLHHWFKTLRIFREQYTMILHHWTHRQKNFIHQIYFYSNPLSSKGKHPLHSYCSVFSIGPHGIDTQWYQGLSFSEDESNYTRKGKPGRT